MKSHQLPTTWRKARLGECCEIVSGATPSREIPEYWGGTIDWVTPKDLGKLGKPIIDEAPEKITEAGYRSCSSTLMPKGAVLFSSRAPIGLVAIAGRPMCTNQGFKSVVPGSKVVSEFLYWCLRWLAPDIARQGTGSTFKEIAKPIMENVEIPLPPLDEQRRIAAILDKADAIRRKRQESISLTEEFLRSTFLDMFGDPVTNPKGWKSIKLEQICSKITDGTHKTPTYVKSGVIFISAKNIKKYRLDWNDVKYITNEEHEFLTKRCKAEFGDILLSKSGSIGAAAKVRVIYEFSLFESLALIKYIRNKVNGDYLQHYLNSDHMKRRYVSDTKGLAIRHLHLNEIRNIDVLLPPLNLQNQFSDIINSVESTSAKQVSTNCSFNELFESLTHRAFRGEL